MWSLACLGLLNVVAYHSMIEYLWEAAILMPPSTFTDENCSQLRQFYTASMIEGGGLELKPIPPDIRRGELAFGLPTPRVQAHYNRFS